MKLLLPAAVVAAVFNYSNSMHRC